MDSQGASRQVDTPPSKKLCFDRTEKPADPRLKSKAFSRSLEEHKPVHAGKKHYRSKEEGAEPPLKRRKVDLSKYSHANTPEEKVERICAYQQVCCELIRDGQFSKARRQLDELFRLHRMWNTQKKWLSDFRPDAQQREAMARLDQVASMLRFTERYHDRGENIQDWSADLADGIQSKRYASLTEALMFVNGYLLNPEFDSENKDEVKKRVVEARRHLMWILDCRALDQNVHAVWLDTYHKLICCEREVDETLTPLNERQQWVETERSASQIKNARTSAEGMSVLKRLRQSVLASANPRLACISLGYCSRMFSERFIFVQGKRDKQLQRENNQYFYPANMLGIGSKNIPHDQLLQAIKGLGTWRVSIEHFEKVFSTLLDEQLDIEREDIEDEELEESFAEHCCLVLSSRYLQALEEGLKPGNRTTLESAKKKYGSTDELDALNLAIAYSYYREGNESEAAYYLKKIRSSSNRAVQDQYARMQQLLSEKKEVPSVPTSEVKLEPAAEEQLIPASDIKKENDSDEHLEVLNSPLKSEVKLDEEPCIHSDSSVDPSEDKKVQTEPVVEPSELPQLSPAIVSESLPEKAIKMAADLNAKLSERKDLIAQLEAEKGQVKVLNEELEKQAGRFRYLRGKFNEVQAHRDALLREKRAAPADQQQLKADFGKLNEEVISLRSAQTDYEKQKSKLRETYEAQLQAKSDRITALAKETRELKKTVTEKTKKNEELSGKEQDALKRYEKACTERDKLTLQVSSLQAELKETRAVHEKEKVSLNEKLQETSARLNEKVSESKWLTERVELLEGSSLNLGGGLMLPQWGGAGVDDEI